MIGLARLAVLAAIPLSTFAGTSLFGLWDATVTVNGVEIPFRLELSNSGNRASGSFFNGDERVQSTSGDFDAGTLQLNFDQYGSKLTAKLVDGELAGAYDRGSRGSYPFRAHRMSAQSSEQSDAPSIAGLWEIQVKSGKGESAWQLNVRQTGPQVTAAVLRIDGDTGTLTGRYRDGKFVLSHFSGARPSLFEITPAKDGTLDIVQNGSTHLKAYRPADARAKGLPEPNDPAHHTTVKDPSEPFRFSGPDLNGARVSESDPRFQGKVVIVSIGGSWCPNCHDEAPFLEELHRKYHARGLEIVTLSFEEADQLKNPTRLRAFVRQYGIEYTVLLGGEPEQVHERLPQAVNLNTWPATFFLGRDGRVRSVHAGFTSVAFGDAHRRLKEEITRTVERLLAENIGAAR